ncbi:MAG: multicopper oxidase domain-containing protein [Caldilineaceae bacterium]|nr:multicopper oxidase domain-containing protein [Caldilineaceae bacterium]
MDPRTPGKFSIAIIGILALMLSIGVYLFGSTPTAQAQTEPTPHAHDHSSPAAPSSEEVDLPSQWQELQTQAQHLSMAECMERMTAMMDAMKAKMAAMHSGEHVMDPTMHESMHGPMMEMMDGMMSMAEGMMAEMMALPMSERMEAMPSMMGMMGRMMQMMGMMQKHDSGEMAERMEEKSVDMGMKRRMSGMMGMMGRMMSEEVEYESAASETPAAGADHDHGAATPEATAAAHDHSHGAAVGTAAPTVAAHDHSQGAATATPATHDHGATAPTPPAAEHDHSSAVADDVHAGHHPPIPAQGVSAATETTGGQPLTYTEEDGVKVFELTAKSVRWTILDAADEQAVVTAWSYNGTVPGPMIRVVEGDAVRILLKNELPEATSIHWHGMPVPFAMDGMTVIEPGDSFAYEFTAPAAGTYMYHSHTQTDKQVMVGLYAPFIVDPQEAESNPPVVDVMWMLSEWRVGADGETYPAMPMSGLEPNYFTINGKAYPSVETITVKKGERVRIRLAAIGQFAHPMHLHGMNFRVVGYDGVSLPPAQQMIRSTITVNPGEIVDIEFVADNAGSWMFHCHIPHHLTNDHVEPGGLISIIEVVE